MVLNYIPQVRSKGTGVIFATRDVRRAHAVGNALTALNRGSTLGTHAMSDIGIEDLMAGGRELQSLSDELGGPV